MKSSASRDDLPIEVDLYPFLSHYIVSPEVIKVYIGDTLSPVDYQVRIMKLAGMISPLPWGWIFLARSFMPPFLCFPAKNRNCIKTLTILRPSSKQNYLIRLLTIVNTVIRSLLWCHPLRFDDRPCIFFGGEEPEIIEILPFRGRSSEPSK